MHHHKGSRKQNCGRSKGGSVLDLPSLSLLRSQAGVTLLETVVAVVVLVVGLAGVFSSGAQSFALLRRAREMVAAREDILSRLDTIYTLSYSQLSKSSYLSTTTLVSGVSGDANPFGTTTAGMINFTETVTVYALGSHLFSSDTDRDDATPESAGEYGSQIDAIAPAAPKTYKATSTSTGAWSLQTGSNVLPYIKITRAGTGSTATTTVNKAGDLSSYSQLRVDVVYTWTDSNNVSRTQIGTAIVSNSGNLP